MSDIVAANETAVAAARAFYCDVLRGRHIRRARLDDDSDLLFFCIGDELITTGPAATKDRIALVVADAIAIAERCWDAGFTVHVRESAGVTTIAVIDPFELELELISSDNHHLTPRASTTRRPPGSRPSARAG